MRPRGAGGREGGCRALRKSDGGQAGRRAQQDDGEYGRRSIPTVNLEGDGGEEGRAIVERPPSSQPPLKEQQLGGLGHLATRGWTKGRREPATKASDIDLSPASSLCVALRESRPVEQRRWTNEWWSGEKEGEGGDLSSATVRTGRAAARDGKDNAIQAGPRASRAGGEERDRKGLWYGTREQIPSILFFDPPQPPSPPQSDESKGVR